MDFAEYISYRIISRLHFPDPLVNSARPVEARVRQTNSQITNVGIRPLPLGGAMRGCQTIQVT